MKFLCVVITAVLFFQKIESRKDLYCYICDSEEDPQCGTSSQVDSSSVRCSTLSYNNERAGFDAQQSATNSPQEDYRCFQGSIFNKQNGRETFVKSCLLVQADVNRDDCDYVKNQFESNYAVVTCSTCNENYCNRFNGTIRPRFNYDAQDNGGASISLTIHALLLLLLATFSLL